MDFIVYNLNAFYNTHAVFCSQIAERESAEQMDIKAENEGDSRVVSPATAGAITNDNSDADGGEDDAHTVVRRADVVERPAATGGSADQDTFSMFDSLLELGEPGDAPL